MIYLSFNSKSNKYWFRNENIKLTRRHMQNITTIWLHLHKILQ